MMHPDTAKGMQRFGRILGKVAPDTSEAATKRTIRDQVETEVNAEADPMEQRGLIRAGSEHFAGCVTARDQVRARALGRPLPAASRHADSEQRSAGHKPMSENVEPRTRTTTTTPQTAFFAKRYTAGQIGR